MVDPKKCCIVCVLLLMSLTCVGQYLKVVEPNVDIENLIPSNRSNYTEVEPNLYLGDRLPHLGFMCILENRQDKIRDKRFTYRMRLGNLDYVNKLEGK